MEALQQASKELAESGDAPELGAPLPPSKLGTQQHWDQVRPAPVQDLTQPKHRQLDADRCTSERSRCSRRLATKARSGKCRLSLASRRCPACMLTGCAFACAGSEKTRRKIWSSGPRNTFRRPTDGYSTVRIAPFLSLLSCSRHPFARESDDRRRRGTASACKTY
mgnify:CR=1 FL=1